MSDEQSPKDRLQQAVEKLEGALGRFAERSGSASADAARQRELHQELEAQLAAARQERDALQAQLETLRSDHASLQEITNAVSTRLDAAIVELQAIMGE